MRIYFDVCCLNRPFDDQRQERVRLETEALVIAFDRCITGDWEWVSADALHVACAEAGGVDVFLTTDDQLLRRSAQNSARLNVRVANPLQWLSEVLER